MAQKLKLSVDPGHATRRQNQRAEEAPGRRKTARRTRKVQERIDKIANMLGLCTPHSQIIDVCSREWKVKPAAIREYIAMAYEDWRSRRLDTPDFKAAQADFIHNAFQTLFLKCLADKKHGVARQCLTELGKIHGIFAPEEHKITAEVAGPGFAVTAMGCGSAEEVQARIEELRRKYLPSARIEESDVIEAEVVDEPEESQVQEEAGMEEE